MLIFEIENFSTKKKINVVFLMAISPSFKWFYKEKLNTLYCFIYCTKIVYIINSSLESICEWNIFYC